MSTSGVNVGGREVFQALMTALMIVVANERIDLGLKVARQEVVLQQDSVLQRLVPSLDLALGLRMIRRAACVGHAFVTKIIR